MMKYKGYKKSFKLYLEALKILPAGVSSNARVWRGGICPVGLPCTLFVDRAKGAYMWDVDGNKYIDYRLGYGPVILGHDYSLVTRKVQEATKYGAIYAAGHEMEIAVAKKIKKLMPCAEMLRFSNTGTEATMTAIRVARAVTKRDKIIKFEGHFHGIHDNVLWSTQPPFDHPSRSYDQVPHRQSLGMPKNMRDNIIIERWNQFDAIEKTVKKYKNEAAAIIAEPIMGNAAAIMPEAGYLQHLKELCERYGMLLIFDEVKTGFRVDIGGAQKYFGVKPELATIAKAMGNGYPVSALVGRREYMEYIGPGKVSHGGTYSSNPLSLAAVNATLDELKKRRVINYIRKIGSLLIKGLKDILTDYRIPHVINGVPGMFQIAFTEQEQVREWRDLRKCELGRYPMMQLELIKRGVLTDADIEEPLYLSYSHDKEEIAKTLVAYDEGTKAVGHKIKRGVGLKR